MEILTSPRSVAKRCGTAEDSPTRQNGGAEGSENEGGGTENQPPHGLGKRRSRGWVEESEAPGAGGPGQ
jgi:hypothetical protein